MAEKNCCALILLAAGASKRMGQPKQLLPVRGKSLLRQVATVCLTAPVSPVVVVLGANSAQIAPCLDGLTARIVINPNWSEGMGTSLRFGMEHLLEDNPTLQNVVIALGDQPDLSCSLVAKLIEAQKATGRSIVASECDGVRGPPVLFTARHFPELLALRGDAGARELLKAYAEEITSVPLAARLDLDTPVDYRAYAERAIDHEDDSATRS